MSEQQQQPDIEVIGAATPPQLSEAALADY